MSDLKESVDVEVPEPAKAEDNAPPTLAELADAGFAPQEIEMAKKQGLLKAEGGDGGDKGDGAGGPADKGDDAKTQEEKGAPAKKAEPSKKTVDERYRIISEGRSPEAIIEQVAAKGDLTPDQETVLVASLTNNGKTLYWNAKRARLRAQKAEAEAFDRSKEVEALKAENAELKKRPLKAVEEDPLLTVEGEPVVIDTKKKPLTLEDLDRIESEKQAKAAEEAKKRTGRAQVIHDALEDQQVEALDHYDDFQPALELAKDILNRANSGTLKELYPDSRQQTRIIQRVHTLLYAFANADKFESGQYNAADMTYDLAKEHPQYGKKTNANGSKNGETAVDGNPEDVERAVKNANRRGSSAILNGGGSRRVALDELTPEQAARLPDAEFRKLPKATRERLLSA
jgi:hypothetical protein